MPAAVATAAPVGHRRRTSTGRVNSRSATENGSAWSATTDQASRTGASTASHQSTVARTAGHRNAIVGRITARA